MFAPDDPAFWAGPLCVGLALAAWVDAPAPAVLAI